MSDALKKIAFVKKKVREINGRKVEVLSGKTIDGREISLLPNKRKLRPDDPDWIVVMSESDAASLFGGRGFQSLTVDDITDDAVPPMGGGSSGPRNAGGDPYKPPPKVAPNAQKVPGWTPPNPGKSSPDAETLRDVFEHFKRSYGSVFDPKDFQYERDNEPSHEPRPKYGKPWAPADSVAPPLPPCFTALGVEKPWSVEQIKAAWRRAAITHHPDRGGKAEVFRVMKQAYEDCLAYRKVRS